MSSLQSTGRVWTTTTKSIDTVEKHKQSSMIAWQKSWTCTGLKKTDCNQTDALELANL